MRKFAYLFARFYALGAQFDGRKQKKPIFLGFWGPEKTAKMLFEIAETAFEAGHFNASVSAVKELNQMAGITVHRSQNLNINANIDNMSKDDIKKRLGALLGVTEELSDKDQ